MAQTYEKQLIPDTDIKFPNILDAQSSANSEPTEIASTLLTPTCSAVDFAALKEFYETLHGDSWKNNPGWAYIKNNDTPPANCTFAGIYGVASAIIDGQERVTHLQLHHNNLSGPFPQLLGTMTKLEILDLSLNPIEGDIPVEFFNLP